MVGVDVAQIARIQKAIQNEAFVAKTFTAAEREYCSARPHPEQSYAGIFCAKEAAVKAIKQGFGRGIMPLDIEVTHDEHGAPALKFYGGAEQAFCGYSAYLSISHDGDVAMAAVMLTVRGG